MTLPITPSFRLDGRRALVPGGSRGVGLACAAALAEQGAHVVIAARSADELAEAVKALTSAGHSAEGHRLDVTNLDAQAAFFEAHGPFDILCNSAGIARHSPAAETGIDDYEIDGLILSEEEVKVKTLVWCRLNALYLQVSYS